ncbi:MAG: RNA pseudouridine synthase [Candidatus Paceibacterota bacterium]
MDLLNEIKVIYENENFVAINKPSGLMVHDDGKTNDKTLCDWILKNYPQTENIGEPTKTSSGKIIKRPGIVHRLDKETSGVILIAKNQKTFEYIKKQFQNRQIKKTYITFVYGEIKNMEGTIDSPIGKSKKDFRQFSSMKNTRGELREAITKYKVLKKNKDFSFVEVYPKTGRTHQIRVHLKSINHPIVCDSLYAPKGKCPEEIGRLALHSSSIEFKDDKNVSFKIDAPIPENFENFLKNL